MRPTPATTTSSAASACFEGDVVSHHAAGGRALVSGFSHRDIRADVNPTLKASDALAIAHERIRPMGPYVRAPEAELVLVPERRRARERDADARARR